MKSTQTHSWAMIPVWLFIVFLCIAPELHGRTVLSFGSTAYGSFTTLLSDGVMDFGRDGKFSWEGLIGYSSRDLLENPRQDLSLSANIAFDSAFGHRIAMGDLEGLPALRLLLNPLEFPYSNLPHAFSTVSPMGKIPLVSTTAAVPLEGIVYAFSLPSGLYLASFAFCPVFSLGGARGGGFVSVFNTKTGMIELGGYHSEREDRIVIPDEILYGRYPFSHGSYMRIMLRSNPLTISSSQLHATTVQPLINLSYSYDPNLGGGIVQGISLILNMGLLNVVWEKQSLPIVFGSPSFRIPLGDTYLQGRTLVRLSCASRFFRVDWKMDEKIWYVAPYASSYQKKNNVSTAEVTYKGDSGSIGVELSTEISFNDTGGRACKRQVSLPFQIKIGSVSTKFIPYYQKAEGSVPIVALSGGIEGALREGFVWGTSFRLGQKSTSLTMKASYCHGVFRFACELDELRRMSLSITIDR